MSKNRFPIYPAAKVLNPLYSFKCEDLKPILHEISVQYPYRLDAMAINPAAVAYNEDLVFNPGEVTISINKFIKTNLSLLDSEKGVLVISKRTRRKVLVKHAYYLITKLLGVSPSLSIDVDDSDVLKHCGFGSSSCIISSVAASINELYGNPIPALDLIKYLASNHGEEVCDSNENELKAVQSIGGGASGGLLPHGILIIAGHATPIASMDINADVLIAMPKNFQPKNAEELMNLEDKNLWKFINTGKKYKDIIAYNLLHKALPGMVNQDITELSNVVFDYRFNMGSINNCSFVYPRMCDIASALRTLYEEKHCIMLALSSVGPAFFALVTNDKDKKICKEKMEAQDMDVSCFSVYNQKYQILNKGR